MDIIIPLVSVIGITLSGVLTTLFHSRCVKVSCCWGGLKCNRVLKDDNTDDDEAEKVPEALISEVDKK